MDKAEEVYVQLVAEAIAHGFLLKVPHGFPEQGEAWLVDRFSDFGKWPDIIGEDGVNYGPAGTTRCAIGPLDKQAIFGLIRDRSLMCALTENGTQNRLGWRDAGVDGSQADVYVMLQ